MESCHWTHPRCSAIQHQSLPYVLEWAERARQFPWREFNKLTYTSFQVTYGISSLFIKKKDGSLIFVQDYHKLNDITIKNAYPLPLVPDIMNNVSHAKAKYLTKLNVRWGYSNVHIEEGDEWKAAFQTNCGLYEPHVMFFSLTNSPATFQTMMNDTVSSKNWLIKVL